MTYLHRRVHEEWSLAQLGSADLSSLFITNVPSPGVLSPSILLVEQFLEPELSSPQYQTDNDNVCEADIVHVRIPDPLSPFSVPPKLRLCRSIDARRRRNRRRNLSHRQSRDNHFILRYLYYRFTLKQMKQILREQNIRYVHIKMCYCRCKLFIEQSTHIFVFFCYFI
jgi:hypothetical protein